MAEQLNSATACIFAAEVAIKESERFNGIPALSVPAAEPIRHAEALIQQALTLKRSDETRTVQQDTQPVEKCQNGAEAGTVERDLRRAADCRGWHGVGGRGITVANSGYKICLMKKKLLVVDTRKLGGGMSDFDGTGARSHTAYSLADKPALAPGFAAGLAANMIGLRFLERGRWRIDSRLSDALGEKSSTS